MKELVAFDLSQQIYYHIRRIMAYFQTTLSKSHEHAPGAQRSGCSPEMQREEGLTCEGGDRLMMRDDFRGHLNVVHEATGRCPPVCREHDSDWVGPSRMAVRRWGVVMKTYLLQW